MLNEISAEMLLEQLYPELTEEWLVRCKGVFYRNYSSDAMQVDAEERQVELARDGFVVAQHGAAHHIRYHQPREKAEMTHIVAPYAFQSRFR